MSFFDSILRFNYSRGLHQQLKGLSLDCNGYNGSSAYQLVSLTLLITAGVLALNYYYGLFNRPRFARFWIWFLNLLVACGIVGTVAYMQAYSPLQTGRFCPELRFSGMDCLLFSLTAMVYTALVFLLFSALIKWKSVSNKKVPF